MSRPIVPLGSARGSAQGVPGTRFGLALGCHVASEASDKRPTPQPSCVPASATTAILEALCT